MPTMGALESRFADLIWSHEPMASKDLIKMAEKELNWKSSTSYTVLKRLCERGIFQLQDKTVTSLISREEFYGMKSEQFLDETFDGSLPAFIAAFGTRKKLPDEEVEVLKKLIDGLRISEWEKEYATLSGQRTAEYTKLKETRAEVAELHNIRKCVDIALKADQPEQTRAKRHDLER